MKKIYTAPLTKVVNIKVEKMLVGSEPISIQATSISGIEDGFEKADKDDYFDDYDESLW